MVYNTPELLLVGAAQNLVLGSMNVHKISVFSDQLVESDTLSYLPDTPDSASW